MPGFSLGIGTPSYNPSIPAIGVSPSFGGDWQDIVQAAVNDGLQVYSTVARNQQIGQQISQGMQPTVGLIPATPTGANTGITPSNAVSALSTATGLSTGMLLLIAVVLVVFLFFKR